MKDTIDETTETFEPSSQYLGSEIHAQLGLTDAILLELAARHLIITDDFRLASRIIARGGDAINFNNLRAYIPRRV